MDNIAWPVLWFSGSPASLVLVVEDDELSSSSPQKGATSNDSSSLAFALAPFSVIFSVSLTLL